MGCVKVIKNRKELSEETIAALEEVVMDSAKAKAIVDASKTSMGMDISQVDLMNIDMFANRVVALSDYRKGLAKYLQDKMGNVAPNLAASIGDTVGARLISHAGSLTNLAKYPASTVQILGAEKALFRALKTRGNTPKYGLIFHSTFIGRAGAKNKGRISRYLANKCSIASRVDNFSDIPTAVIGDHLKQPIEDRLKVYETGENPAKNIDVMRQAVSEAGDAKEAAIKAQKKQAKKMKRKLAEMNESMETADEPSMNGSMGEEPKKKKKKKKDKENDESQVVEVSAEPSNDAETPAKEKKKKKKKKDVDESANETLNTTADDDETPEKKKKKKKKSKESQDESMDTAGSALDTTADDGESLKKKKKKKKK